MGTISDAQYTQWLDDPKAVRCVLVEVSVKSGTEITRYASTVPYYDTVGARHYLPRVIAKSVKISENINIGKPGSLSFGNVSFQNADGQLDSWLSDIWAERDILVVVGDVRWTRDDFRTLFAGTVEDIDSKNSSTISLKVRDNLQRLNSSVTDTVLGGSTANAEKLVPLTFGEVHNISPLLINPATLTYKYHPSNTSLVIEVRDNGVPVNATFNNANGEFTLTQQSFGTVTASVRGDDAGTWVITASRIIEELVTRFGEANKRLTASDIDLVNFGAFDSASSQSLGVYINSKTNLLTICNKIANSVGGQLYMNRLGKLSLFKLEFPPVGTPVAITDSDMISGTLKVKDKVPVRGAQKIGYCKNWTRQETLDTGLPAEHKDLFEQVWLEIVSDDATTKADYRLDADPEMKETFMLTKTDATAEATRILNIFKVPRFIFTFKGKPRLTELQLGDAVTLTHPRLGLSGGKTGVVVGYSVDWDNLLVDIDVLV
jgi:hypothetical protein